MNIENKHEIIYFQKQPLLTSTSLKKAMLKVYLWLLAGLGTTMITAAIVAYFPILYLSFTAFNLFSVLLFTQIFLVVVISFIYRDANINFLKFLFFFYSAMSGLSLDVIFSLFNAVSIIYVFLATMAVVLGLGMFGYVTQYNLKRIGSFCLSGLFAAIILYLFYFFDKALHNNTFFMMIDYMVILLFIGITMYDTQKIKEDLAFNGNEQRLIIMGALTIYLDFLNFFTRFLNYFGVRK